MTKREHFLRYLAIIKKLQHQGEATFEEIVGYLERDAEIYSYHNQMSKRTFQRDLLEILSLFNIEIKYDHGAKVYRITEAEEDRDMNHRMLEALDIVNLCNLSDKASPYVSFEKRRPVGTEHFNSLLHAIQTHKVLRFTYEKYWDGQKQTRSVEPYALRESHNRWYLVANDQKDSQIKTFGLDRMSNLNITTKGFIIPKGFQPNEKFRHCFGVLSDPANGPVDVVLSVTPTQGKYIKSFPLHESQKILADNGDELRISLYLDISRDFIMELMSLGDTLTVISPKRLINELKHNYESAIKKYNK